jgi:hypothetical protein
MVGSGRGARRGNRFAGVIETSVEELGVFARHCGRQVLGKQRPAVDVLAADHGVQSFSDRGSGLLRGRAPGRAESNQLRDLRMPIDELARRRVAAQHG